MRAKNRTFQDLLLERLANSEVASNYLNEALGESIDSFLVALKTVAQAHQMAKVAREAGVQRETLYRSLSEQGNPTLDTLSSILGAVGLTLNVSPKQTQDMQSSSVLTVTTEMPQTFTAVTVITTPVTGTTPGRGFYSSLGTALVAGSHLKTYPGSLWDELADRMVPNELPSMFVENIPPPLLGGLAWRGEGTRQR
jgi:probable addiction module antidote protein